MFTKISGLIYVFGKRFGFDASYYAKHGAWSLAGQFSKMAGGALLAIIFARLATVEVFGQYQYVFSVVAFLEALSIQGFNQVIVRDTAQGFDGTYLAAIGRRIIWGMLAGLLLLGAAAYYIWPAGRPAEGLAMAVGALLLPLFWGWRSWIYFLRGKKRFDLAARFLFWQSSLMLLVLVPVIYMSPDNVTPIFATYMLVQTISSGFFYYFTRRYLRNNNRSADWASYSYFLSFNGLLQANVRRIDKVIIGAFFSPALLAVYTVALVLPEKIIQITKDLIEVTVPVMNKWERLRWREIAWALLFGLFLAALVILFTKPIINWVFGTKYSSAMGLAYVAAASLVFYPLMQLINNFAVIKNKRRALQLAAAVSPLIRLLLLIVLSTRYGVLGLVILFSLAPFIQTIVTIAGMRINWRGGLS